jgi:hypothetical protein
MTPKGGVVDASIGGMSFWKKLRSPDVRPVTDDSAERRAAMLRNRVQGERIRKDSEEMEVILGVNGFTARFMTGFQLQSQKSQENPT